MLYLFVLLNTLYCLPLALTQVLLGFIIHILGRLVGNNILIAHGKDLALAADQNMNVIWLGNPDETISSRTGRAIVSGKPKWYIKYLLYPFVDGAAKCFGDHNHCIRSIEYDEQMDTKVELWKWYKK